MNNSSIRVVFLVLSCLLVFFSFTATAQEESPFGTSVLEEDDFDMMEEDTRIIENVAQPLKDKYVSPDVKNLSKLYWTIGKLDIEEDKLVDYYLMINECEMYLQFYHNDFEWGKIRDATRQYILNNMELFPTHFEIIAPVALGRYDVENEEFDILEQDKIIGLRRLDFAMNMEAYKETCAKTGEIYEYPANIIIILSKPFFLEKIPVKRELAKLYIEEAKRFYETLPPVLQMRNYERLAFIRLKVQITQYKNTIRVVNGDLRAVVFGHLDGYEVYADPGKMKPLYSQDTRDRRFKRLRRTPITQTEEDATEAAEETEEDVALPEQDQ